LAGSHEGDPANRQTDGLQSLVRGHVDGVARGINIPNAQPDQTGLASVNSDLHLGTACAARAVCASRISIRYRDGVAPRGWHDSYCADRILNQQGRSVDAVPWATGTRTGHVGGQAPCAARSPPPRLADPRITGTPSTSSNVPFTTTRQRKRAECRSRTRAHTVSRDSNGLARRH